MVQALSKSQGRRKQARGGSQARRLSSARKEAYAALDRIDRRGAFAQDVMAATIDKADLSEADRAFATRLVLGVVSMKGSLDAVLDRCMRSPSDVKPDVRCALRISAYEALYLDKDAHAVVDQGVELVRSVAPKAAGLANAVLRKVVACREAFPFGDPETDLRALSLLEGFPPWLTELLACELGFEAAARFEHVSNEPAPVFVFENPLRSAAGLISEVLQPFGGALDFPSNRDVPLEGCLLLSDRRALAQSMVADVIGEGLALVSDASAQAVAAICAALASAKCCDAGVKDVAQLRNAGLKDAEDVSVLELCSGRGTKTIMMQGGIFRLLGRQAGRYVAVDNVPFKCDLLKERAARFGVHVSEAVCAQLGEGSLPLEGDFDVVLLDAPCSGLGTLRRHPEIRWRITPDVVAEDAERDAALLAQAAQGVRLGGFLVYATCTVTHEEDMDAVRGFLESDAGSRFRRVSVFGNEYFRPTLRSGGPDAHFCAVMQRIAR